MSHISKLTGFVFASSLAALTPAHAAHYSVVYNFAGGADGAEPFSGLIDVGGTLYGTTWSGGAKGDGAVYGVTTSGTETMLYSFKGGTDGINPWGGLAAFNGMLYGTTFEGGKSNFGTVFQVTSAGVKTTLHSFAGNTDGSLPVGAMIQSGKDLYGTTSQGGHGSECGVPGCGTVFSISPAGKEKVVFVFGNYYDDVNQPLGTLLSIGGELYGTSYNTVDNNIPLGTVFKTTRKGVESVLHRFGSGTDGADPVGGLIDYNGTFYGTTESGGATEFGTVFSITPAGVETVLYNFTAGTDGGGPQTALINVGGTFYGVTGEGYNKNGQFGSTVFSVTPAGVLTTLHTFGKGKDGQGALGNLIKVDGKLYGTTAAGGTNGTGTIFEIEP
jgi:uncharacterized repeat protein (TIGR03803 family)